MSAISQAKDTLLRALDQLEKAEMDLGGEPERVDLVVTYEIGRGETDGAWHSVGGWASTGGPKWLHAALLRRAADAQTEASRARAQDDEDEPGDGESDGD